GALLEALQFFSKVIKDALEIRRSTLRVALVSDGQGMSVGERGVGTGSAVGLSFPAWKGANVGSIDGGHSLVKADGAGNRVTCDGNWGKLPCGEFGEVCPTRKVFCDGDVGKGDLLHNDQENQDDQERGDQERGEEDHATANGGGEKPRIADDNQDTAVWVLESGHRGRSRPRSTQQPSPCQACRPYPQQCGDKVYQCGDKIQPSCPRASRSDSITIETSDDDDDGDDDDSDDGNHNAAAIAADDNDDSSDGEALFNSLWTGPRVCTLPEPASVAGNSRSTSSPVLPKNASSGCGPSRCNATTPLPSQPQGEALRGDRPETLLQALAQRSCGAGELNASEG
ncbi:unnamed protein product, partial [Discosporangium mesarthrocarpum]